MTIPVFLWRLLIWLALPFYVLGGMLRGAGEGLGAWQIDRSEIGR